MRSRPTGRPGPAINRGRTVGDWCWATHLRLADLPSSFAAAPSMPAAAPAPRRPVRPAPPPRFVYPPPADPVRARRGLPAGPPTVNTSGHACRPNPTALTGDPCSRPPPFNPVTFDGRGAKPIYITSRGRIADRAMPIRRPYPSVPPCRAGSTGRATHRCAGGSDFWPAGTVVNIARQKEKNRKEASRRANSSFLSRQSRSRPS